jgi:hypothetical protein
MASIAVMRTGYMVSFYVQNAIRKRGHMESENQTPETHLGIEGRILMEQRKKKERVSSVIDWTTLKGKFFHTFDEDGYVQYQGQIVDFVGEDIAIVLYFEWFTGSPTYHKAVWVSDIVDEGWALYGTAEAWQEAYEIHLVKTRPPEK